MGMGQAAGIAAALAVGEGVALRQIDVQQLPDEIVSTGGILQAPESDVKVGNPAW
jgi:hypothetical protein